MNPARTLHLVASFFCLAFFPIGCVSTDTSNPATAKNGYSETEWVQDSTIRLNPGHVAAIYLEPYDGVPNPDRPDSGGPDYDVIPLVVSEGNTFTYSLDPDDATGTIASAVMLDSWGNEVFTIDAQTPSAMVYLPAGKYDLQIYSAYADQEEDEDHRIVFLNSAQTNVVAGIKAENNSASADLQKLLSTKSCPYCDLSRVYLQEADLTGADLTGANMYFANLTRAKLTDAKLARAYLPSAKLTEANLTATDLTQASLVSADMDSVNLTRANLAWADMDYANLPRANLTGAKLYRTRLTWALLIRANLASADLTGANLIHADLAEANLLGAHLSQAIMPDGSVYTGPDPYPKSSWP